MKRTMLVRDPRFVARIVNLAHQHGCGYTELRAAKMRDYYRATIELEGPACALRRLEQKIMSLLTNEEP
ncbi:MAG TPA: hypothetical protein VFE17_08045 [Candidatus Baltobacteraceae bacterium]|jgi:glycine cleavage system regulatory protein|nr:hypothetical protein [Candidatus Baltobacteraceae bacterium]